MSDFRLPWLELAILAPLVGAIFTARQRNHDSARNVCLVFTSLTFAICAAMWQDFRLLGGHDAVDLWHLPKAILGRELFVIDEFSAPLLPLTALLYVLVTVATHRTKVRRFSFKWSLVSESVTLATFACKEPWGIIGLMAIGAIFPYLELTLRKRSPRVFLAHMGLCTLLFAVGQFMVDRERAAHIAADGPLRHSLWAMAPLLAAVLLRSGIAPLHCWVTDLFEHATFGTAILFVAPLACAYSAVRLVLPAVPSLEADAPNLILKTMANLSLFTALYAGGLALVQTEARRFFAYLFLSHSALVLVGLETETAVGVTGSLLTWFSVTLSLAGFGLTIRAVEARHGRITLDHYHGLYDHMPALAVCYLITGLASVGFPGTLGYIGTEMLFDSVVQQYPYTGAAVVLASAFNGIAVVKTYFLLFTGKKHASSIDLGIGVRERFSALVLAVLLVLGGIFPQLGVASRYRAAERLLHDLGVEQQKTSHGE